ncbi:MAG TPA: class I SAM-dependent methyltransferase [Acidimicrobiales bacterium]|nr:class I SAM-dependent methyltransferase [Acidimicrobiales bacterium]
MGTWVDWHADYDRPGSSLSRRLEVVKERLRQALAANPPGATVLSLCSGDGRDVMPVVAENPGRVGRAVLVELDPILADRAKRAADQQMLSHIEVRGLDAGDVGSFADVLPVDVLLLCGIFGNIAHLDVKGVIAQIPKLLRAGGHVIWTRGGSQPDRRPEVRRWFLDAGLEEVGFDGEPEPYGVGLNRLPKPDPKAAPTADPDAGRPLPARLFTFEPR